MARKQLPQVGWRAGEPGQEVSRRPGLLGVWAAGLVLAAGVLPVAVAGPASAHEVVDKIPVGDAPFGVAASEDRLYVANDSSNNVSVIDRHTAEEIHTIPVGESPRGVVVSPDGSHAYVTNHDSDTVSVIDTSTFASHEIEVGDGPNRLTVSPDGSHVYVTNETAGTVSVICNDSPHNTEVIATIPVGESPNGAAVADDLLYVGHSTNVSVIDTKSLAILRTIPLPDNPVRDVAVTEDHVYVTHPYSDSVSVIDRSTEEVVSTIEGLGNRPSGIVVNGSLIHVANYRENTVSVIDRSTYEVVATVPVDEGPSDLAAVGDLVYIANRGTDAVSVIHDSHHPTGERSGRSE